MSATSSWGDFWSRGSSDDTDEGCLEGDSDTVANCCIEEEASSDSMASRSRSAVLDACSLSDDSDGSMGKMTMD